jgi:radical SAM protein with 4Fe4S-binding SPASM domain
METVKDCRYAWEWLVILSDGNVMPCCYAKPVGNLNDSTFEGIWNGQMMQELRRDVIAGRINAVCKHSSCKFIQNMPGSATNPPRSIIYRALAYGKARLKRLWKMDVTSVWPKTINHI